MAKRLLAAVLLAALVCSGADAKFSRHSFPKGFVFGTGSLAETEQTVCRRMCKLLKDMNLDAFRFSISWTRILPSERRWTPKTYHPTLGMRPFVTIFHWDTPLALEENKDYVDFADVCFKEFGDRVKDWTTFNEPWTYQAAKGGQIGITVVANWYVPGTDTAADRKAVQRSLDYMYGWFLDPIVHGV
ncbi:putative beta-glucosidase 35 [Dichanthelium oligosanthes]|uniref:Putative beta-glucosidase 35 n=1 Tax=Dichanthelium oligosanthes TaxID=888268 RepID=A0A1E5VV49_9POAL|nr:putative beta-glucosidase 35 [Dichanthelium oligosanthes]